MSTYYYLLCETHKEISDAVSRTAGGYCQFDDSDKTLLPFIIAHCNCKVRIINEHDTSGFWESINYDLEDLEGSGYRKWQEDTVKQEIEAAKKDNRWR